MKKIKELSSMVAWEGKGARCGEALSAFEYYALAPDQYPKEHYELQAEYHDGDTVAGLFTSKPEPTLHSTRLSETSFRRGFHHGAFMAFKAFEDGFSRKEVSSWIYSALMRWRYCLHEGKMEEPPQVRKPKKLSQSRRFEVLNRDNFTCQYCGASGVPLHVDHVHPRSKGGTNDLSNLKTACVDCNHGKSDKSLKHPNPWERKGVGDETGRH